MLTKPDKRPAGAFTLTEVLVGIVLLTIVWLAAVNVIIVSRDAGSLARHKSQAVYLIQEKIENLRKKTFSSLANGTTTATVTLDTRGTPSTTTGDLTGTMTTVISTPNTYYKKILISISWYETLYGKRKTVKEFGGTYIANDAQAN
ncbi:MAG: hypothetical protein PHI58_05540 [Candidatus Omnitrophica bacterium]|nr:hypothetical protein [Candidatus Omnitrophota bacterium]